jgi:hypothetical protein
MITKKFKSVVNAIPFLETVLVLGIFLGLFFIGSVFYAYSQSSSYNSSSEVSSLIGDFKHSNNHYKV